MNCSRSACKWNRPARRIREGKKITWSEGACSLLLAVVWDNKKNDGGCCDGDCSSFSLCRGSSLYFFLISFCFDCSSPCQCLCFIPLVPVSSLFVVCFVYVSLLSLPPLFSPVFLWFSLFLSFFFGSSLLFLLFFVFFLLSLVFPPLVFGPFCGFYSQRMHVFSMIIKTFRTVIAGVMVTVGNSSGVGHDAVQVPSFYGSLLRSLPRSLAL